MKSVFISKNTAELNSLNTEEIRSNYKIVGHSFLQFEALDFEINAKYEVIFFGSKRSIDFFLEKERIPKQVEVACFGRATADYLKSKGVVVNHFSEDENLSKATINFAEWLGRRQLLVPCSDISLRSFTSAISSAQLTEVIVYNTIVLPKKYSTFDIYIFSSPSNVRGFFALNNIPKSAEVYSWGESTQRALKHLNQESKLLSSPSINAILEILI